MRIYPPKVQKTVYKTLLERFWPQNGVRIDLTVSGRASYIQVGPRGFDFRGPGALKPQLKAQKTQKLIFIKM